MKKSSLKPYMRNLRAALEAHESELSAIAKAIIDATDDMNASWSGSWLGWHSNLYFADYQQPSIAQMFDVEWGGLQHLDSGWKPRTLDELWGEIRRRSKLKFDLDDTSNKLDQVVTAAKELKTQLELVVTNKTLKKKVAETDPAFSMMKYVKYRQPRRAMSRDSTAVNQGFQVPPHIQCAAFGQAIRVDIDEAKELLRLADIALKDSDGGVDPWRYTNPFWLIYRGGKFVIDLVRQNRIKALVGLAVALVGLIAADYALAWRNLNAVLRFLGLK